MKRIFTFTSLLLVTLIVFAQDIIITTDSKKIDAKILEVSKSEIKYKEKNNLKGPVFILSISDINSIIYSNGKVVLYNQHEQSDSINAELSLTEPETSQVAEIAQTEDNNRNNTSALPAQTSGVITTGRIYRDNRHYLHNDVYISSKEVARILERENSEAYARWKKADGMLIGGAVCTGIGGGLVIGGLLALMGEPMICIGIECGALVPLGVALGLTLGASSQYNKALDIYNSKYDHATVQLRWSVAPNGIGIALAF